MKSQVSINTVYFNAAHPTHRCFSCMQVKSTSEFSNVTRADQQPFCDKCFRSGAKKQERPVQSNVQFKRG